MAFLAMSAVAAANFSYWPFPEAWLPPPRTWAGSRRPGFTPALAPPPATTPAPSAPPDERADDRPEGPRPPAPPPPFPSGAARDPPDEEEEFPGVFVYVYYFLEGFFVGGPATELGWISWTLRTTGRFLIGRRWGTVMHSVQLLTGVVLSVVFLGVLAWVCDTLGRICTPVAQLLALVGRGLTRSKPKTISVTTIGQLNESPPSGSSSTARP